MKEYVAGSKQSIFWISVQDGLPREEDWCYDCLVYRLGEEVGDTGKFLSYVSIAYYEHGSKHWYSQDGGHVPDVTHWAELPNGPL